MLLFPDTFTNYFTNPISAWLPWSCCERGRLRSPLDLAGGLSCCGRPLISNGLLDEAVAHARHNVATPVSLGGRAGTPIIACEPSCILTIKDDYPALLSRRAPRQAEAVAAACRTFEEVAGTTSSAEQRPRGCRARVRNRSWCRRTATSVRWWGCRRLLALLRRLPAATVVDLDAGCCGLAGSFGYEMEHYEVSRLVGEQRLLPLLRQAAAEAVVAASGFSCRLQIAVQLRRPNRPASRPAAARSPSIDPRPLRRRSCS